MADTANNTLKARGGKFTPAQVADALRQADGLISHAARNLHTTPDTIRRYIDKHDSVRQAHEEARGALLDDAEAGLAKAVRAGYWPAIAFALRTVGASRGYGDSAPAVDVQMPELTIRRIDLTRLTDDELEHVAATGELPPGNRR